MGFEYEEESEVQGVPGYKYVGGVSMMDNGTLDPSTECYCNGECVPVGVTNLTVCRFGAPAFASYPHFYLADPLYTSFLRGIKPVKEKHQFYLILEPVSTWWRIYNLLISDMRTLKYNIHRGFDLQTVDLSRCFLTDFDIISSQQPSISFQRELWNKIG